MPSRIIKESITTSESLSEVSAEAERLFWRLVVKADDFGLYYEEWAERQNVKTGTDKRNQLKTTSNDD